MKLLAATIWLMPCSAIAFSQTQSTQINGTVYDEQGQPISYVNVYIEGSIDGASSGEDGTFSFTTEAQGTVTLKASFIGYQIFSVKDDVKSLHNLKIVLKSDAKNLDFFQRYKILETLAIHPCLFVHRRTAKIYELSAICSSAFRYAAQRIHRVAIHQLEHSQHNWRQQPICERSSV